MRDVVVSAIIKEYGGVNAYMNRRALQRFLQESERISGAFLQIDQNAESQLYRQLKATPRVGSVIIKHAMVENFERTIAENMLMMRTFNILFSIVIACGVVYNGARISLAEQSRELATLRVIGFTRGEVGQIVIGELAILTLAAVPLGCLLGYGLAALFVMGLDTEIYRIPLVIERSTYVFASIVVILAAAASALIVQRRIRDLDLIAVLKTRE